MRQYKYVVLFPIPEPYSQEIRKIMEHIKIFTGVEPLYHKLPPHVTFHEPLTGIDENMLKFLVGKIVSQAKPTRLVLHELYPFGKKYIVIPVLGTRSAAKLWTDIDAVLSRFPEYTDGAYDDDNTLHVTVFKEPSQAFSDTLWKLIERKVRCTPMEVPLEKICLYRKPIEGGVWEEVCSFSFQK